MTNSQSDYASKLLKSAATFFGRWNGARGEMIEMSRSHKTLRILLSRKGEPGNLLVACIEPLIINGPVEWSTASLSASLAGVPSHPDAFRVFDAAAGLSVVSLGLEIKENVKV